MTPKNLPLFYAGLVAGLAGCWLFVFALYFIVMAPGSDANIGAGLLGMFSWIIGATALLMLVGSFVGTGKPRR